MIKLTRCLIILICLASVHLVAVGCVAVPEQRLALKGHPDFVVRFPAETYRYEGSFHVVFESPAAEPVREPFSLACNVKLLDARGNPAVTWREQNVTVEEGATRFQVALPPPPPLPRGRYELLITCAAGGEDASFRFPVEIEPPPGPPLPPITQ